MNKVLSRASLLSNFAALKGMQRAPVVRDSLSLQGQLRRAKSQNNALWRHQVLQKHDAGGLAGNG
jgi:hypothetical protein